MFDENFVAMFLEFIHEYADDPEMLKTLKPFIDYGWPTVTKDGKSIHNSDEERVDFIRWLAESGAHFDAIKAVINMMA